MNLSSQRKAGSIRNAGFLLSGVGLGVLLFGSDWVEATSHYERFFIGMSIIAIGNFLRAARTEEEKKNEFQRKKDRYARTAERLGNNRIKAVHRISIIGTLILFAIALTIIIKGSMDFVWPLIALIIASLVVAAFTTEPSPTRRWSQ